MDKDQPKVKYSRKEYRDEYLKSDHWKTLRGYIVKSGVLCFKCKDSPATDAHHLNYKNIVDVKITDLVPLCRPCHELVEEAKRVRLIKRYHSAGKVLWVSQEEVDARKKKFSDMVPIPSHMIDRILSHGPECQKVVCGIIKKNINHPSEWKNILVTGLQLFKIHGAVPKKWKKKYTISELKRSTAKKVTLHY